MEGTGRHNNYPPVKANEPLRTLVAFCSRRLVRVLRPNSANLAYKQNPLRVVTDTSAPDVLNTDGLSSLIENL